MPGPLFRTHEWLAERVPWIQFPRQQFIPRAKPPVFKTAMPAFLRFGLVVFGSLAIAAAAAVIVFLALLVWAAATA